MPIPMTWIIVAAVVALLFGGLVIFNRLVRARNMVREAWSGIDVQLRRRSDLIPNLVETVKAYAAHERGVFDDVTARRAASVAAQGVAQTASSESALQGALGRLLAVAESYPQLKADQNFLALQTELSEIEDQLQMARRYYNGTVRDFNIAIQTFPDALIAHAMGMHEEYFFETDAASKAAPTVSLSGAR
jgi:LemA protein